MTKAEALSFFDTAVELAGELNIHPSAISQWSEDCIPELREYQIREIIQNRPEQSASGEG